MKIGIVAPSSVPFTVGGAEKLWWGLARFINQETAHGADLIKLPSPEQDFWQTVGSYRRFSELDLEHFDVVLSTKYPAWMVTHECHHCYLQHRLRGLYDTYPETLGDEPSATTPEVTSFLEFLHRCQGSRAHLQECFERLDDLRGAAQEVPDLFAHPGPLGRATVRFLDSIGLAADAIKRFFAISRTVAMRDGYFPPGAKVDVIYHPSNLETFRCRGDEYLFAVSRLDGPKRVALLIDAMAGVRANIELVIAGTGPDEEALRDRARGDHRIRFLGFVSDQDLVDLYADALAVLFVPDREDFGLITLEGMKSGKPVITTSDSGGPVELVQDGMTGFVVPADPVSIAEKIEYLCRHRSEARAMGRRGRAAVDHIDWQQTVSSLLPELGLRRSVRRQGPVQPRKVVVATTFPIHPVRGGGQARIYHLFRHLAPEIEVDVVSLGSYGEEGGEIALVPGFRELRIPRSAEHEVAEAELSAGVGYLPLTDVGMSLLYEKTPLYLEVLSSAVAEADVVVASHPYVVPAIRSVSDREFWYEAQDVEVELKSQLFPDTPEGVRLIEATREVEAIACSESSRILVCSDRDAELLTNLYGVECGKFIHLPNGVDTGATPFLGSEERGRAKRALGTGMAPLVLFVGSWHEPNIDAVRTILGLAEQLPEIGFLVMGSAGLAVMANPRPANVGLMGVVDDRTKALMLSVTDLAINPMRLGSGTNLKILEYCAAGIPVLTSPHGIRGLELLHEEHVEVAPIERFAEAIGQLLSDEVELDQRGRRARSLVARRYEWRIISQQLVAALSS